MYTQVHTRYRKYIYIFMHMCITQTYIHTCTAQIHTYTYVHTFMSAEHRPHIQ